MELESAETVVREDHRQDVPCVLCRVDDAEVLFEAGVAQVGRIVRCRRCGLMYVHPRTQLADAEDFQRWEPEGLLRGVEADDEHPWRSRYLKERLQVRDYARTRALLGELHPRRGRLLEVGSGLGYLLRSFREDGWDVQGLDPWREVVAFVREQHGIDTVPTTLEQAAFPAGSFDAVVMLHVIEHVPDPVATLREVHRVLAPGGHLVLETPRYDSLAFKLLGRRERSLSCDGHIYFFTTESLRACTQRAGFAELRRDYVGRSLTLERLAWNLGTVSKSTAVRRALGAATRRLPLQRVRMTLNLRDMIRVVLRKPHDLEDVTTDGGSVSPSIHAPSDVSRPNA